MVEPQQAKRDLSRPLPDCDATTNLLRIVDAEKAFGAGRQV